MTDAAVSTLADWLSSRRAGASLAHVAALDVAIEAQDVTDAKTLQQFLVSSLGAGDLRSDAIVLALAYRCETDADLAELSAFAMATHDGREDQEELMVRGLQFNEITRQAWGIDLPDMAYPIAVGYTANLMDAPLNSALLAFLSAESERIVDDAKSRLDISDDAAEEVISEIRAVMSDTVAKADTAQIYDISPQKRQAAVEEFSKPKVVVLD